MKSLLISGLNGFVGTNFINYLSQSDYRISGLSRKNDQNTLILSNSFNWDELFRIQEIGFDTIIHLAGKAHDLKKSNNSEEYFNVNTGLTKMLFDVFLKSKSETFIYLSSVKAVADHIDTILIESIKPDPQTAYGKSKLSAEEYLLAQKLASRKRMIILRPCMIHGPGNKGNLNLLYQFVKRGIPYPLAAFENKRSFLFIENLCYILKRLIDDITIPSGVYHVADDEALSTNDVVKTISQTLHRKPRLLVIPPYIVRTIAATGDAMKIPLNSERLKKLTENYIVSNEKIKKALHIDCFPVPSREGLRKTIASFGSINY